MKVSLVAAVAQNRVIGLDGRMPWHIPGELALFRELTTGRILVIGRKTHESIGRVLPDRTTVIVTRQRDYEVPGAHVVFSVDEAFALAKRLGGDVVVGGGSELYAQTLEMADRLYLSHIHASFDGDTFFPEFSAGEFREVSRREVDASIPYSFVTYERIRDESKGSVF